MLPEALDKAKIKVFVLIFLLNYPKQLAGLYDDIAFNRTDQIKWNVIALLLTTFFLKVILSRPVYFKSLVHLALITSSISVFTALNVHSHHLEILVTQHVYMLVAFSFYGLGRKWGFIYSFINIFSVIYCLYQNETGVYSFVATQYSHITYIFITIINFLVIVFTHYYFHGALYGTIRAKRKMSQDLAKTAKDKTNFLSTMSHELRTPLNSVIGMTNILIQDDPNDQQMENLKVLKFSAENLLSLINNILDFNKIESENIVLEEIPFNVAELFKNIQNALRSKADEKGVDLRMRVDEEITLYRVIGDPTRLSQVLINIVDNALKFTHKGYVSLSAETLSFYDDRLTIRFQIEDTGIGISEEKQQLIFEPFKQAARNVTRMYGGTGLGLPIVKHLLHLSGSEIHISSRVEQGTTFWFDITYRVTDSSVYPPQKEALQEKKDVQKAWKILLAEDNKVNVLIVRKLFALWGISLKVAENGEEAIALLLKEDFDVVLMDIHMPVMDGLETSAVIRKLDDVRKSNVKIIALTASVSEEMKKDVFKVGMNDYISKPFKPEELLQKLKEQMNSSSPL